MKEIWLSAFLLPVESVWRRFSRLLIILRFYSPPPHACAVGLALPGSSLSSYQRPYSAGLWLWSLSSASVIKDPVSFPGLIVHGFLAHCYHKDGRKLAQQNLGKIVLACEREITKRAKMSHHLCIEKERERESKKKKKREKRWGYWRKVAEEPIMWMILTLLLHWQTILSPTKTVWAVEVLLQLSTTKEAYDTTQKV